MEQFSTPNLDTKNTLELIFFAPIIKYLKVLHFKQLTP